MFIKNNNQYEKNLVAKRHSYSINGKTGSLE
jgi:hypothetical protein